MRFRIVIALTALLAALVFTTTAQAKSGIFNVSVTGKQSLNWSIDGTRGSCEIRRGQGSGTVSFSFKSPKSAGIFVDSGQKLIGSLNADAKGTTTGNFTESTVTPCGNNVPQETLTDPGSGCGARAFKLRMDFNTHGAFVYVTGPVNAFVGSLCPFPIDSSLLNSTDLSVCGDSTTQYKRSWGVSSHEGQGLFASKIAISTKTLLKTKKGKTKVITGKASVDCKPQSTYSGPVNMVGELHYSLSFKRSS